MILQKAAKPLFEKITLRFVPAGAKLCEAFLTQKGVRPLAGRLFIVGILFYIFSGAEQPMTLRPLAST